MWHVACWYTFVTRYVPARGPDPCLCCSDRLQTLFASSMESTKTVATMLAQSGGSIQQSYWTSPQTQKLIEQEGELRSVVFAQMLGATS